jgi:hypothetical protein
MRTRARCRCARSILRLGKPLGDVADKIHPRVAGVLELQKRLTVGLTIDEMREYLKEDRLFFDGMVVWANAHARGVRKTASATANAQGDLNQQ